MTNIEFLIRKQYLIPNIQMANLIYDLKFNYLRLFRHSTLEIRDSSL